MMKSRRVNAQRTGRKRLDIKISLKDLQGTLHFLAPNGNSAYPPFFVTIPALELFWRLRPPHAAPSASPVPGKKFPPLRKCSVCRASALRKTPSSLRQDALWKAPSLWATVWPGSSDSSIFRTGRPCCPPWPSIRRREPRCSTCAQARAARPASSPGWWGRRAWCSATNLPPCASPTCAATCTSWVSPRR